MTRDKVCRALAIEWGRRRARDRTSVSVDDYVQKCLLEAEVNFDLWHTIEDALAAEKRNLDAGETFGVFTGKSKLIERDEDDTS